MSKGTRREREACEIWQAAGFATYRPATVQYGENDIFGDFDMLAMGPPRPTWWVQVKANRAEGIEAWCERVRSYFDFRAGRPAYAVPYDNEGWRLIVVDEDGREDVYDERSDESVGLKDDQVAMGAGLAAFLRGERDE